MANSHSFIEPCLFEVQLEKKLDYFEDKLCGKNQS